VKEPGWCVHRTAQRGKQLMVFSLALRASGCRSYFVHRADDVRFRGPTPACAPDPLTPRRCASGRACATRARAARLSPTRAADALISTEPGRTGRALRGEAITSMSAELAELADTEVHIPLLPQVERRLAHAQLATHIGHRRTLLGLPDPVGDLLLRNFDRFMVRPRPRLGGGWTVKPTVFPSLVFNLPNFSGMRSGGRTASR
jgi:hypothetical protein